MNTPLRVAAVGAGWVTVHRHLPALARHSDVRLVGVVAPDLPAGTVSDLRQKYGMTRFGATLDEPWLTTEVDAVVVGTPPDTHADIVCRALELGSHVLVEKPFALTVADADRMIDAAATAGRTLAVVHNLQYSRAASRARRMLESGALGELRGVFGVQSSNHRRRLPSWYPSLPLGLFTDEAPHLVYLLQSFLPGAEVASLHVGPPFDTENNTPDLVSMVLRGADGDPFGSLQMTFVGAVSEWLLVLAGSRGTAVVDFFRDVCLRLPDDGGHLTANVLRTQAAATAGHALGTVTAGVQRLRGRLDYGNDEVVRRFVAAVRHGADLGGIDAARGRDVVAVLQAAHEAARLG